MAFYVGVKGEVWDGTRVTSKHHFWCLFGISSQGMWAKPLKLLHLQIPELPGSPDWVVLQHPNPNVQPGPRSIPVFLVQKPWIVGWLVMSKKTSWWLNQPTCKKTHSFSKGQSENKSYLKPPSKRVCLFCFDCCACFFLERWINIKVSKFQEKQADTFLCGCMYVTCIHPSTDAFWKAIPKCWLYMVFLSYPSWKYTTIKKTCNVG